MESPRGLTETLDAIRSLRELGATRVRVGDVEVTFAAPLAPRPGDIDLAPPAPALSPEEAEEAARKEYEATLYHSS